MPHSATGPDFHASSSSPPAGAAAETYTSSPVIIAFMLGILVCFTIGFFCIYFCRCCSINYPYSWAFFHRPPVDNLHSQIHSPTGAGAAPSPIQGLDPALLQIFPTFPYSSVKDFQEGNNKNNNKKRYSLECAICLLEFEEDSFLRLLTVCCHVFHQECIDLWLQSHKTCPVCRTDLDSSSKEKEDQTRILEPILTENNQEEIRIDMREEGEEEAFSGNQEERRFSSRRSHSTGHSIVVIKGEEEDDDDDDDEKENEDRYTLKLPEHVQMKLIRAHNYAKSCCSYTEMARLCSKCRYAEAISSSGGCTTILQLLPASL